LEREWLQLLQEALQHSLQSVSIAQPLAPEGHQILSVFIALLCQRGDNTLHRGAKRGPFLEPQLMRFEVLTESSLGRLRGPQGIRMTTLFTFELILQLRDVSLALRQSHARLQLIVS
jgi:hypothetical protein